MNAEHVDPFVTSAFEVLGKTADARPERGSPVLRSGDTLCSRELTALVALEGDLVGVTFYSMSLATAAKIGGVIGKEGKPDAQQFDDSAISELARMITETGVALLAEEGCRCTLQTLLIVRGFGEPLTEVSPVLVVPLFTEYGDIDIGIALQPPESIAHGTRIIAVRAAAVREGGGAGPSEQSEEGGDVGEESETTEAGEGEGGGEGEGEVEEQAA